MPIKASKKNVAKRRPRITKRAPRKNASGAPRARITRMPVPAAPGQQIRATRGHTENFAASESVLSILVDTTWSAGTILADMLVSPRLMPCPLLNHRAQAWTNYRFRSLSFEMVSFYPTTAAGGIAYGVTRDVDAEIYDSLQFVKSCESSVNSGLSAPRTRMSVSCSPSMNKQRYFSTLSQQPPDFAQFRFLAVLSQALSGLTVSNPIYVDVIVHYDVEFSGPVAPSFKGQRLTAPGAKSIDTDAGGQFTTNLNNSITLSEGDVYIINPRVANAGYPGILAAAVDKNSATPPVLGLFAYSDIDNAFVGKGPVVDAAGSWKVPANTFIYRVGTRSKGYPSALKGLTPDQHALVKRFLDLHVNTQVGVGNRDVLQGPVSESTGSRPAGEFVPNQIPQA